MFKNIILFIPTTLACVFLITCPVNASVMEDDLPAAVAAPFLPDIRKIAWADLRQGNPIGTGGCGDVYEGQWQDKKVAIKILRSWSPDTGCKFANEVSIMWEAGQHPGTVQLHGVCFEQGYCIMVMELLPRSLHDLIHSPGQISDPKILQFLTDIAQNMVSLHSHNIYHLDLKSKNILLD